MKVVLIASSSGGSAKTTVAVRLAEELTRLKVRCGIVDLSPYPTASYLSNGGVQVVQGRGATTTVAARCVLKPYEDLWDVAIVDTGRMDDPILDYYSPLVDAVILTTRPDPYSLRSLQTVGQPLQRLKAGNPNQSFMGFLPVMTSFEGGYSIMPLRQAAGKYMINHPIPASSWEWKKAHQSIFQEEGVVSQPLDSVLDHDPVQAAVQGLAVAVLEHISVAIPEAKSEAAPTPTKEVGALTKLWRMATKNLGPKATVEGAAQ